MIEFFTFSWIMRILITFILGICVLSQTLALVLNFFCGRQNIKWVLRSLFEISILCGILVFSLLHGQMVNSYENDFFVASGYENIRILIFSLILIFAILLSIVDRNFWPFSVIPGIIIVLPIMENLLRSAFPWFFITGLIFFLIRSIKICISSIIAIRTSISALSVINAIDTLQTGVLFSEKDGYILLSNYQMQKLMIAITGKIFRNSKQFYQVLISEEYNSRYKKAELDGQMVYVLADASAWMITKTDISLGIKSYVHISIADVSKLWELTTKLQLQEQELRDKSEELKDTIANLHILSKEREIENAKMRAHDILGQRLSVLLRIIENEKIFDYDLLTSLSRGLLDGLKAEQNEIRPYDEIKSIQEIFAAIGVDIRFQGELPENNQHACLFVDIIREASTNAVRHGLATEIDIKVQLRDKAYNLTISNNGHTSLEPITPGSGIGVMKKKVGIQGGNLDIIHHPQFALSVILPGGEEYARCE